MQQGCLYLGEVAPALQVQDRHEVGQPLWGAPVLPGQHEVQKSPKVHLIGAPGYSSVLAGGHMLLMHPIQEDLGEGTNSVPAVG